MNKKENIKKDLQECIQVAKDMVESFTYDLTTVKHPSKKRTTQNTLDFWTSMNHHLTEFQNAQKLKN